ncbi:MAG: 3-deoxy-D-manno-octulosonic acid transferase, partial [Psychrobacter sp.]
MPSSHTPSDSYSKATDPASLPSHAVYHSPFYYQFAISLLKPLYRLQVWRRSHKRANYQQEVAQRFGKSYPPGPTPDSNYVEQANVKSTASPEGNAKANKGIIWCHAVSLGETNTVAPLLDQLLADGYKIWLTNTTQTGFARGASRFADDIAQGRLSHSYVPVDSPAVIERFLAHVQPIAALFVETELWANILTKLSEHRIPSILV